MHSWGAPHAARQKRIIAAWAAACIILVALFYGPIIFTGYRKIPSHDEWLIINAIRPYGIRGAGHYFEPHFWQREISAEYVYYRPIALLSHAIDYCFWGTNPHPAHAVNIALHGVNVLLLGWLVALLASNWLPGMLAGLLYAVLPTHAEPVCWVAARMDVLSGTFALASMLSLVLAQKRGAWLLVGIGALFFLLAVGAKETGGMLAVAVILWALMMARGARRLPLIGAGVLSALAAGYVWFRHFAGTIIMPPQRHHFYHLGLRLHAYYLSYPLAKLYEAIQARSVMWLDGLGLARGTVQGVLLWRCLAAAAVMLVWRIAFYAPALLLVQADNRYLYLPEMGSAGLLALTTWQAALWLRRYRRNFGWLPFAAYAYLLAASMGELFTHLRGWKAQ